MSVTQDKRLLQFASPLGKDYLMINRFSAREAISELFQFEAELVHLEDEADFASTSVDPAQLLGQQVTVKVSHRDGVTREFSGIVRTFQQGGRDTRFSKYYATIVPHVWLLTQIVDSRIFQTMTVPDILREILADFSVKYELSNSYEPRNYCVQYGESSFDFISRLMEEDGIYYYFTHSGGKHEMLIADTPQSHRSLPGKSEISYSIKTTTEEDFISTVKDMWEGSRLQTGKVTFWDHNFQLPHNNQSITKVSRFDIGDNKQLESYEYPGGYAKQFDGIGLSGAEQSDLGNIFPARERSGTNANDALDVQYMEGTANSDCCSIVAGHKFKLTNHPNLSAPKDFLVTNVVHEAEQNPSYISDDDVEEPYVNSFAFVPAGQGSVPFVPAQKTPKPRIFGGQTAYVVGPPGEEIFTDKYGRVKVQFHWDRDSNADSSSSCWLRVAQIWAGNSWGSMFIPRIGMEVVVTFLEGDPDQPLITGCVYNPESMPAYTLPDEKTKSGVKTDSSKGSGGFNELRFEDRTGEEQVFIHAEKDMDIRVKNEKREIVLKKKHVIVKDDQHEQVEKDKHLEVKGKQNEKIGDSYSQDVKQKIDIKAGQNYAVDAGMNMHLKSGVSLTIETGTNLTLKVGGNFININPGGVFIKGTMVMINSGGAAGSGAGSSPQPPVEPTEAAKADPGSTVKAPPPARPPAPPRITSLVANQFVDAAREGTPFVSGQAPPPVVAEAPAPAPTPAPAPAPVVAPVETKPQEKTKKYWVEIVLVDMDGKPVPGVKYKITPPGGGTPQEGTTNQHGQGGYWNYDKSGDWKISFPDLDQEAWD